MWTYSPQPARVVPADDMTATRVSKAHPGTGSQCRERKYGMALSEYEHTPVTQGAVGCKRLGARSGSFPIRGRTSMSAATVASFSVGVSWAFTERTQGSRPGLPDPDHTRRGTAMHSSGDSGPTRRAFVAGGTAGLLTAA